LIFHNQKHGDAIVFLREMVLSRMYYELRRVVRIHGGGAKLVGAHAVACAD
jgi:hypothetical protein